MERPVGGCVYSTRLQIKYYSLREVGPNSHKERANFGFYVQKESNFYEVAIMQDVCSDLSCFLLTMMELLQNFTIVSVCYTWTKKAWFIRNKIY